MPRFKPKLTDEERAPQNVIVPERVQKLIDLYDKNKVEYDWTEEDKQEQTFEYRRQRNLNSYKYTIASIYRVRDVRKQNQYYFYQMKGECLNDNNSTEFAPTLTYGYAVEPEHQLRPNLQTNVNEPIFRRNSPVYFLKWDPEEVKKLLDGSEEPCVNFQIGTTGSKGQGDTPIKDVKSVPNQEDFLEGDFDDLLIQNKTGVSSLAVIKDAKAEMLRKEKKKVEATL
jgi:hypothetical protein